MRTEIFINKTKFKISITILSFLSVCFAVLSYLSISNGWTMPILEHWFLHTVFIIATIAFGAGAMYMFAKSKDTTPALIVESDGFTDNSGIIKGRKILWSEVRSFEIKSQYGMAMIHVYLNDPETFMDSYSGIKKSMLKSTHKQKGTPIALAGKALDYDFNALLELLNKGLKN